MELARALLKELNDDLTDEKPESDGGKVVKVQFNPETLKVTFANQIQTPTSSGDQAQGSAGRQYVGAGTTKLALLLWFDVSAATDDEHRVDDVRRLTQAVLYFMTPREVEGDPTKFVPPGVRFHWGTFSFDGIVDSMEETLEFFSRDGHPLRASVSMNLSQQKILKAEFSGDGRVPGTNPLASAPAGAPLHSITGAGAGTNLRAIAEANQLDSMRRLQPGQLIDLNPFARRR